MDSAPVLTGKNHNNGTSAFCWHCDRSSEDHTGGTRGFPGSPRRPGRGCCLCGLTTEWSACRHCGPRSWHAAEARSRKDHCPASSLPAYPQSALPEEACRYSVLSGYTGGKHRFLPGTYFRWKVLRIPAAPGHFLSNPAKWPLPWHRSGENFHFYRNAPVPRPE